MIRNNDRMLLESLVRKYGKNGVRNAIRKMNESEISSKEAFKLLDELFDKYVPASGKADTYGGEILRAFAHLYYRCYNDGDVPFIGYGNETCNSSYRFLHKVSAPGFEKEYPMQSTYKEWFKYLDSIVVPFYQWISSEEAEYYFTIENTTDSRKALPEDFMYDEEDDYYDEYYDDED